MYEYLTELEKVPRMRAFQRVHIHRSLVRSDNYMIYYHPIGQERNESKQESIETSKSLSPVTPNPDNVLRCFISDEVGTQLKKAFSEPCELVTVMRDLVKILERLKEKDFAHRDISEANVMVVKTPGQDPRTLLIDFESSRRHTEQSNRLHTRIAGSLPFMACQLVQQLTNWTYRGRHRLHHDLESVFWLGYYVALDRQRDDLDPTERRTMEGLDGGDADTTFTRKLIKIAPSPGVIILPDALKAMTDLLCKLLAGCGDNAFCKPDEEAPFTLDQAEALCDDWLQTHHVSESRAPGARSSTPAASSFDRNAGGQALEDSHSDPKRPRVESQE
ncbi:hypothetical protein FRB99_001515 [Tulasnella sp. 403]|nr:hypothetical protein FRB99_001515 [Tulasnella sp. 403]